SIKAGQHVVVLLHSGKKAFVAVGVEVRRIGATADKTERLITKTAQQSVVASGFSGTDRVLETKVGILLHEAQWVRSGEPLTHAVAVRDLGKVGGVIGSNDRRPQLVDHATAVLFEGSLKAAHLLVSESEVLDDGDDAFELHFGGRVMPHRMHGL